MMPGQARTWVFDVDGSVVDSHTGTSLRPGARELFEALRADGVRVVWWSAGGAEYAAARARGTAVGGLVDAFYDKAGRDTDGRYRTDHVLDDPADAVFVDDRPEDMPIAATVVSVSPYLVANPHDRGLARALGAARVRQLDWPPAAAVAR